MSSVRAIGISHNTSPVEAREQLAVSAGELPAFLGELRSSYGSGYVLSTCNRTEVYVSNPSALVTSLADTLIAFKEADPSAFDGALYDLAGEDAVRHLFRVASGIDSMVVGEAEILGQVRAAMSAAHAADSIDPVLSRLLHMAVRVGRRARHETSIARYGASVSTLAVKLARRLLGKLRGTTVLVVSAGEAGKLAAKALANAGVSHLLVTNRNAERAGGVARLLGGQAVDFARMPEALASADIVISSSGAEHYLVTRKMAANAIASRDGKPVLFIDIAVPRDIDPAIKGLPNAHLYDIDDLQELARDNIREREKEVAAVEAIVDEEVERFGEWWSSLDVVPTIAALRERGEEIRRSELERTLARMPALAEGDRERLDALTRAIMKKVLHAPISHLRDAEGRGDTAAVRRLFDLDRGEDLS